MNRCIALNKTKWRGIPTTSKRIGERKPKTVINRFGQKTISLPRIDDKKRWAGYAGITGISRKVAKMIPKCKYFVEPFAGTAKVYQALSKDRYSIAILNDKSPFINKWLKSEFPEAVVTKLDFATIMKKYDSTRTVYLIDSPWNKSFYDQSFSWFDRASVAEYDNEIINLLKTLKAKFVITTRTENKRMKKSGFKTKTITSEYELSGHYPKALLTYRL